MQTRQCFSIKQPKSRTIIILPIIVLIFIILVYHHIFTIISPPSDTLPDVILSHPNNPKSPKSPKHPKNLGPQTERWSVFYQDANTSNATKQSSKTANTSSSVTNTTHTFNYTALHIYDSQQFLDPNDTYPWGHIYNSRVWCSVLTMWPERRQNIEAVANTWAKLCDHIVFVVDNSTIEPPTKPPKNKTKKGLTKIDYDWEEAPDSFMGYDFIKMHLDLPQSEGWRNIWEKSWKTWYHVGTNHINDSDWFLKIDDDTFFSPVNFKGFARYYNPDKPWYFGNTLMHLWKSRNIVFNSGSCYALSRGALTKLVEVFDSDSFQHPSEKRHNSGTKCKCLCIKRPGAFEDPSMGVCLHSVGIDPSNTMDILDRERFIPFRKGIVRDTKWSDTFWYFKMKPMSMGVLHDAWARHPISFHFYKHQHTMWYNELNRTYNVLEGVDHKRFEIPQPPRPFRHKENIGFTVDRWRNSYDSNKNGQLVYLGPGKEKSCWKCNN